MAEITTYINSKGDIEVIKDMADPRLVNAIAARARKLGGGTDAMLDTLRAELASRPPPAEDGAAPATPLRGSGDAQKRDGTTEPVADPRSLAQIGDNNPPEDADPFLERLEADNAALMDDIADHELKARKLPKEVTSDDDLALINAWVIRARELWKRAETTRIDEKEPYLTAGKKIDGFFTQVKSDLTERAKTIEQRNAPYLAAKAAREEAERLAQAAAKRAAAEEAAAAERDAQAAARKAAEEAAAAEKKIRDAATEEARLAAEEEARQANKRLQTENRAAEQAGKDVKAASNSAARDEKIAAGGGKHSLGRTAAGGGSSTLKTVWKYRLLDTAAASASLGPLQPFLSPSAMEDALARAAKADPRPIVPGVEFYAETESQTR